MLRRTTLLLVFGLMTVASGCAFLKPTDKDRGPVGEEITDIDVLVRRLSQAGVILRHDGQIRSPELTGRGTEYTVMTGGSLYIFEMPGGGDVESLISRVKERQRVQTNNVKIYRSSTLLAVYAGDDKDVVAALEHLMGERIG